MKIGMQGLIGLGLALIVASGAAAADKPVFGLVMSFSGWFQPIDADTIAGAKLAVDDINAAGGVLGQPIEIVQFDNKSDPRSADGAIDVISKGRKPSLSSDFDFGAPGAYVAQQNNVLAFSAASDPKFGVAALALAYSVSNAAQAQGADGGMGLQRGLAHRLRSSRQYDSYASRSAAASRRDGRNSPATRRCSDRTRSSTAIPRSPRKSPRSPRCRSRPT
jgi:hypothetical protein